MYNKNFINRFITSITFIIIFFTLFYFGDNFVSKFIFFLAILLTLPIGLREFVLMGRKLGYNISLVISTLASCIILLNFFLCDSNIYFPLWLAVSLAMMVVCFGTLFLEKNINKSLISQSLTLMSVAYMSISLGFQVKLFMIKNFFIPHIGWQLILTLYLVVWFGDAFAYFIGKRFGKNKLAPQISPSKTWEGVIGNIIGNLIASFLIKYFIFFNWSNFDTIAIALLLGIAGQLGDLVESTWKRSAGVKDSDVDGRIKIPGHGGLLDRIDSLAFSAPIFYVYVHFILGLN